MKTFRLSLLAAIIVSLLCPVQRVGAATIPGVVVAVVDAVTVSVSTGSQSSLRVSLRGVVVPKDDPAVAVARQHLSDLVAGKRVAVEPFGVDAAGNVVGLVFDGDRDVGMQMIRDGAARYDGSIDGDGDAEKGRIYAECEAAARIEKRGIWQDGAAPAAGFADRASPGEAKVADGADVQPVSAAAQAARNQAKGPSAQDRARALSDAAHDLVQRGQYAAALPLAREAVELSPTLADAQKNLALALEGTYQFEEALKHCRDALRLAPDMPQAHKAMGSILYYLGRFPEAARESREAIRLDPGYAKAYFDLGTTLDSMGRYGEALTAYRNAERLAPEQPIIRYNMGWTFYHMGRTNDARAKWQEVLTMGDPVVAREAQINLSKLP